MTSPTVDDLTFDAETEVIVPVPLRVSPQVSVSDYLYFSMEAALPEHAFGYFRMGVR